MNKIKKYKMPGERKFRDPEKQKLYNEYKAILSLLGDDLNRKKITQKEYDDKEFLLNRKYMWLLK